MVLIGDGAKWIDTFRREYVPEAIRILDFYHAMEHVCAPARVAFAADANAFTRWRRQQAKRLKAGNLPAVLAAMRALIETARHGTKRNVRELVDENLAYLKRRREQMDYPRYRALGLPIGSGLIEGRIKSFVKRRLCGPGCRWSEQGANDILHLKAAAANAHATARRAA